MTITLRHNGVCRYAGLRVSVYQLPVVGEDVLLRHRPPLSPSHSDMEKILSSEQETIEFGKTLSQQLRGGDILFLSGELGAGKTTLTKGIAAGLGVTHTITSPTFTLMNIYPIKNNEIKQLVHIDTYRLENEQQLIEIGTEDYLGAPDTVCIVEWPEKISMLTKNKKTISVKIVNNEKNQRLITISERN